MKKLTALLLAAVMCLSLAACGSGTKGNDTAGSNGNDYVGEWKANVLVSATAEQKIYEVYVITLNADGTGTYRDKAGTWVYSESENQIVLTLTGATALLEIAKDGEKTVLKFYQDTYYRASEFTEE